MIDLPEIWRVVAEEFGVSPDARFLGRGRRVPATTARQVTMAIARELTPLTQSDIARWFRFDASMAHWAIERVQELCDEPTFAARYSTILARLRASSPPASASAATASSPPISEADAARIMDALEHLARWQPERMRALLGRVFARDEKTGRFGPPVSAASASTMPVSTAASVRSQQQPVSRQPPAQRNRSCLSCGTEFASDGPHNRLCRRCKDGPANGLPEQFN